MQDNNDIIELCDDESNPVAGQVSQSIRAGLPLGQGLIALAEQTSSTKTRNALIKLSKRLDQGMPLADAMRDSQTRLPRSMRALVAAGLETGRLDSIMQYSVVQSQRAASLRLQRFRRGRQVVS